MPNWIKGTLKLRGKREDIRRFFKEGLDPSSWPRPEMMENQVTDDSSDDCIHFIFQHEPHIVGTNRAFITDDSVYMDDDEGTVCIDIKQAWGFEVDPWEEISKKYDIDVRLYGIECGLEFMQEIIIVRGQKTIIKEQAFDDWMWECPFPNMGG